MAVDFTIADLSFDPRRFEAPALELAERGIPVVAFPQSHARMGPASERLLPRSSKDASATPIILISTLMSAQR